MFVVPTVVAVGLVFLVGLLIALVIFALLESVEIEAEQRELGEHLASLEKEFRKVTRVKKRKSC